MGGPLLLVAGGSGVVPLMAMIRHREATGSDAAVRLLYSARSYEEIIYRRELDWLSQVDQGLELSYTFTRSSPSNWTGYRRRIDKDMLEEISRFPRGDGQEPGLAFVCGPTGFVETAADLLVELGHDPARIKTERFGPTGS